MNIDPSAPPAPPETHSLQLPGVIGGVWFSSAGGSQFPDIHHLHPPVNKSHMEHGYKNPNVSCLCTVHSARAAMWSLRGTCDTAALAHGIQTYLANYLVNYFNVKSVFLTLDTVKLASNQ